MNCNAVQDRLLLRQAGELPPGESGALDRHLERCPHCRRALQELTDIQAAVDKALPMQMQAPETLDFRVMGAIRQLSKPRFRWSYRIRVSILKYLAPTAAALFLLLSGYGLGYWNAQRHASMPLIIPPDMPRVIPDIEPVVRMKRLKLPHLHPIPYGYARPKKV